MSIRKQLIKLNNKLESTWNLVDFSEPTLKGGWYIAEFTLDGLIDHLPRIQVRQERGNIVERSLIGGHSGRNRMLIYLPTGRLVAFSKSIKFERLGRVSSFEGRARVLLICFRYLIDFFSPKVLLQMIGMQFQDSFELSGSLLRFYEPAGGKDVYLQNILSWNKYRGFRRLLNWLGKGVTIAVIIEKESQRDELDELLLPADAILKAGDSVPESIDYCIPLSHTEHLREPAILMLKRAIKKSKRSPSHSMSLVYTDHDYSNLDDNLESLHPVFKPEPSRVYLHCFNYTGFALAIPAATVRELGSAAILQNDVQYQIAIDAFKDMSKVLHINEALFLSDRKTSLQTPEPHSTESPWPSIDWKRRDNYNALTVSPQWTKQPSVDLIIPTRDGLDVLKPCITSILDKTTYSNFHIILVDNGSEKPETLEYFDEIQSDDRVSIVQYPGEFNYSAINNFAVAHGKSDYVGLINNDIEVIDAHWLTQMMAWASQENTGIVGAKLLFSNGKIQHAGVIIGMGNAAGHIHRLEEGDAPGYQMRCLATQNMMAVTAACLITPRTLYEELGGLNETDFKVAYNDIDYCLRVEALKRDIIWTPEARLFHHESVTRGDDMSDQHIERYFSELETLQARWKSKGFVDKYYSKHLRISDEGVFPQLDQLKDDELVFLEQSD